ncbi:NAD(P)-dependent oxidoreductase [Pseudomonas sp. PCH446]
MEFLPLFHNLRGRRVLVVGGGEIALRKSRLLADAGAVLRVVAPEVEGQLRELVSGSGGELLLRGYLESDLDGCGLIIAATTTSRSMPRSRRMPIGVACRSMWWMRRPCAA